MVEKMYNSLSKNCELYIIELKINKDYLPIGDAALCKNSLPIVIGRKEFRSKGIGKKVLHMLINRAKELGWNKLRVKSVYTYNERARRLYEEAGFKLVSTTSDKEGNQEWQFELNL